MFAAQLMWDASMAASIDAALSKHGPDTTVVAINGKFHSEEGMGCVEKLRGLRPGVRILNVVIVPVGNLHDLEECPEELHSHGDYVILTDGTQVNSFMQLYEADSCTYDRDDDDDGGRTKD